VAIRFFGKLRVSPDPESCGWHWIDWLKQQCLYLAFVGNRSEVIIPEAPLSHTYTPLLTLNSFTSLFTVW